MQPRPLRGFDEECRKFVTEQYEGKGVNLHPESSPEKITKGEDGKLSIHLKKKSGETYTIDNLDQVLLATGRKSNTGKLGLENVSFSQLMFLIHLDLMLSNHGKKSLMKRPL